MFTCSTDEKRKRQERKTSAGCRFKTDMDAVYVKLKPGFNEWISAEPDVLMIYLAVGIAAV